MAKDTIKIWKAADVLRGNLNASEYEGVVLGLIFLKYISDRFETKYAALVQDPLADPEDKDEYMADNVFFVPKEARWSVISADAHQPSIGVTIDNALRLIEQENPRLKGILPKNFGTEPVTRETCSVARMSTACRSSHPWKERMRASSTPLRVSYAQSLKCCNPTAVVSMTRVAVRAVCSYNLPSSSVAIRKRYAISPSTDRKPIRPHGRWRT